MQNDDIQTNQEILKKLRSKAELCRFSHSELKEKYIRCRDGKEFSIVLLSVISAAMLGLYFREMLEGDLALLFIFILSLLITVIQALDHTVFQWTNKVSRHQAAVTIWGDWIREADFLEKRIHQYSSDLVNEKMQTIQEKYNGCMSSTEQIPNNSFLKYKKKFRLYVLRSKKIDHMSLEDLENEKKNEGK